MAINNKPLGTSANPAGDSTGDVLPKLIDHLTTEMAFQEGMDDVARQVDRSERDIGYNDDITMREGREMRTINDRLDTLEGLLGIADDNSGTQNQPLTSQIGGSLDTLAHIDGTLSIPRINAGAVGNTQLANNAVTTDKVMDGTLVSGDLSAVAGVERTQLETDIQTFEVHTGGNMSSPQHLGSDITVPAFTATLDGVVTHPETAESTTAAVSMTGVPSGDLWVLASDNDWYQLANDTQEGSLIPASRINFTTSGHATSADVASGETGRSANLEELQTFLLTGANRVEGGVQYALENGDIVSLTDTLPTPAQTTVFVYVGATLGAGVDLTNTADNRARFVRLGVADVYGVADSSLTLANNNFSLSSMIPGDRTFSGNVTHTGNLVANGNVDLGNATSDTISYTGRVDTGIDPNTTGTHSLGTSSLRWNAQLNNVDIGGTLTADVGDGNIDPGTLSVNRLNGTPGDSGQIPTIQSDDTVDWQDPPIGVEMGTTLPTSADAAGVLFSLTAQDGENPIGIYRAITANPATWERLGIVNAIQTKQRFQSVDSQTIYTPNASIRAAHYITIDGLVLVEGVDYNVAANRATFTLTSAVAGGKDIEVVNFNDVSVIGQGELPTNVLDIGNWIIDVDGSGNLRFRNSTNSATNIRFGADGMITTNNDITAFG